MASPREHTPDEVRAQRRKILALLVVLATVGIAVALNFSRVQGIWRAGTELFRLRSDLQTKYETSDVSVSVQGQADGSRNLVVTFERPPFGDLSQAQLEAKANEIAQFVHQRYTANRDFRQVEIVIAKSTGKLVTFLNQRSFPFSTDQLDAPTR